MKMKVKGEELQKIRQDSNVHGSYRDNDISYTAM